VPFTNRRAFKRDLAMILAAARERRIPVLVGSAGGRSVASAAIASARR